MLVITTKLCKEILRFKSLVSYRILTQDGWPMLHLLSLNN